MLGLCQMIAADKTKEKEPRELINICLCSLTPVAGSRIKQALPVFCLSLPTTEREKKRERERGINLRLRIFLSATMQRGPACDNTLLPYQLYRPITLKFIPL
jgi:hypothetical protein